MRITTRGMSDKELTEFINVMIKIDPRMEFCREFYKPICTVDYSIKPPINTIRDCNVDKLICSDVMIGNSSTSEFIIGRSIYLLFVGRGMIEIGEHDFIEALNKTLDVEDANRKLSNLDRLQALEAGLGDIKAAIADKSALTDVSKAVREGNAKIEDLARRPIVVQRTVSSSGGNTSSGEKPRRRGIWPFRRK